MAYVPKRIPGSSVGGFTAASIPFAGSDGTLTEDSTNLRWDDTNNELEIGPAASAIVVSASTIRREGMNSITIQTNGINRVVVGGNGGITLQDGMNINTGTATGVKIGTATNQKVSFFNATPVVQQAANAALTDNTGGTASTTLADCTGVSTISQAAVENNFASIAARLAEIRTLLVNTGLGA